MRIETIMTAEMLSTLLIHVPQAGVFGTDTRLIMARDRITGYAPDSHGSMQRMQGSVIA